MSLLCFVKRYFLNHKVQEAAKKGAKKALTIEEAIIVPETTSLPEKLYILFIINDLLGPVGVSPELVRAPKIQ